MDDEEVRTEQTRNQNPVLRQRDFGIQTESAVSSPGDIPITRNSINANVIQRNEDLDAELQALVRRIQERQDEWERNAPLREQRILMFRRLGSVESQICRGCMSNNSFLRNPDEMPAKFERNEQSRLSNRHACPLDRSLATCFIDNGRPVSDVDAKFTCEYQNVVLSEIAFQVRCDPVVVPNLMDEPNVWLMEPTVQPLIPTLVSNPKTTVVFDLLDEPIVWSAEPSTPLLVPTGPHQLSEPTLDAVTSPLVHVEVTTNGSKPEIVEESRPSDTPSPSVAPLKIHRRKEKRNFRIISRSANLKPSRLFTKAQMEKPLSGQSSAKYFVM